jgi:hypothetical protein
MRQEIIGALGLCAVLTCPGLAAEPITFSFEDPSPGQLPEAWSTAKTGEGNGSVWQIVAFEQQGKKGQALAQVSSEGPRPLYNLCVLAKEKRTDVDLSVAVKAVKGEIDQGGGLVWRYRDANNYYITRWNPLETNFRVYHVVAGKRTQLATADVTVATDQWHTVRAVQTGNHIQCYLDGKLFLDVKDETLKDAGAVGLWSKADAVTWFDNLTIQSPAKE